MWSRKMLRYLWGLGALVAVVAVAVVALIVLGSVAFNAVDELGPQ